MPHRTHLEITAPFRIGDIVAEVFWRAVARPM